jgi:hypothetical protein
MSRDDDVLIVKNPLSNRDRKCSVIIRDDEAFKLGEPPLLNVAVVCSSVFAERFFPRQNSLLQ